MARPLRLALLLGLAHGVSDGAAGLLLCLLGHTLAIDRVAALVLLCNLLAFGLQPITGIVADQVGRPRAVGVVGLLLVAAGLALAPVAALPAVAVTGMGGRPSTWARVRWPCGPAGGGGVLPGLFATPGVLGLAIGGALAVGQVAAGSCFLAVAVGLAAWMIGMPGEPAVDGWPAPPAPLPTVCEGRATRSTSEGYDLIRFALLGAIALRLLVWNGLQALMAGRIELLLGMGLAAAAGKAVGGLLADRVGWRRCCWASGCRTRLSPPGPPSRRLWPCGGRCDQTAMRPGRRWRRVESGQWHVRDHLQAEGWLVNHVLLPPFAPKVVPGTPAGLMMVEH